MAPPIKDLQLFLDHCPTAWHAVDFIKRRLLTLGFKELHEGEKWKLEPKHGYFVCRNGSSISAFVTPKKAPKEALIIGTHTDSPGFKLKPKPEWKKENMILLGLEVYGGPLLNSWLNRDLGIAGRIIYLDKKGHPKEALINIDKHPVVIAQLAIHLDREVNEKGLVLNKQDHLSAIASLDHSKKGEFLEPILHNIPAFKTLLGHDLFVYPLEKSAVIGSQKEFIAAYRLDNLASLHASLIALQNHHESSLETIKMIISWDHEEIGSSTAEGAGSPFLRNILERISLSFGQSREDYLCLLSRSLCISADQSHALHPNYPNRTEPTHSPLLGHGVVIKMNAQQKYSTNARTAAKIKQLADSHKIPIQLYVNRSDINGGSTIGPIQASDTGIPTIDIGTPMLSMHAARELISTQDHLSLCKLLTFCLTA